MASIRYHISSTSGEWHQWQGQQIGRMMIYICRRWGNGMVLDVPPEVHVKHLLRPAFLHTSEHHHIPAVSSLVSLLPAQVVRDTYATV